MNKIPYETILDIRKKANIVDVIAKYIPLEKRGKNYFAICPFHDDHNPSMSVSEEKQIYTCFVCGASGNVFNFVMNYENISFTAAVKKVADLVGIKLDVKDTEVKKNKEDKYHNYYKMFDIVNKYYKNNIKSVYGKKAIKYLNERKITDDIINEFEIGLSLNDNSISKLLQEKGYSKDELVDIGICGDSNNYMYDTFRNRIMFPLYNLDGQVVGFSGRIYNGENESKYVNSKESVIFKKGNLLYNYHRAIKEAREKRSIIVVEGFMDVIRLYSVGIKNVVASMGTAITKEHASLIKHLSQNVILSFDGDKAGEKATISAIKELEKIGISPKIIRLEDDLDPDDYIVKKGKDAYLNHLNNALSVIDFNLMVKKENTNFNDFNEVSSFVSEAVKELEKIIDPVVYELTLNEIAKQTNLDKETINNMVAKKPDKNTFIIDKRKKTKKDKYQKAEEYLVHYMLKDPKAILIYQDKVSYLENKKLSIIAMEILEFYEKKGYINVTDFTLFLEDKTDLINEVLRIDEEDLPDHVSDDVLLEYVKTIDEEILKNEINKVKDKIKTETNVQNKIELLEKLRVLKKKECK